MVARQSAVRAQSLGHAAQQDNRDITPAAFWLRNLPFRNPCGIGDGLSRQSARCANVPAQQREKLPLKTCPVAHHLTSSTNTIRLIAIELVGDQPPRHQFLPAMTPRGLF